MSIEQITKLLTDIEKDPGAFQRDPDAVIGRYELTSDEAAALRSGDQAALVGLGVDERLAKAFKGKF